eukprot:scaffold19547_cov66-Phaeocystis_antarctica.AAC.4
MDPRFLNNTASDPRSSTHRRPPSPPCRFFAIHHLYMCRFLRRRRGARRPRRTSDSVGGTRARPVPPQRTAGHHEYSRRATHGRKACRESL